MPNKMLLEYQAAVVKRQLPYSEDWCDTYLKHVLPSWITSESEESQ